MEDPLFIEENESYYYNYLKIFFIKENYYDILLKDNYFRFYNYKDFIYNLKKQVSKNKNKKQEKKIKLNEINFFTEFKNNIEQIRSDILNNSYLQK
jgi:hypothetical protein